MNSRLKNAKIEDIAVTDLIFYSRDEHQKLASFCFRNSISYLPSIDRKSIFVLTESGFVPKALHFDLCLHPHELLFDHTTASKFEKVDQNEIRFVVTDGLITGVVHIVDYNNEFVAVELYRSFFRFENSLRNLLIRKGFTNDDFIKWVRRNRDCEVNDPPNNGSFWRDKYEMLMPADPHYLSRAEKNRRMVYPFQTFYFSDILEFAFENHLLDKEIFQPRVLKSLRNFMAHNRHFVSVTESDEGQLIYDFKHLKQFISNIHVFFRACDELHNQY